MLKLGSMNVPTLFFSRLALAILGPLHFHTNFRINKCVNFCKKAAGILIEMCWIYKSIGGVLPSSNLWTWGGFPYICVFKVYFSNVYSFRHISLSAPWYFILLGAIINKIIFLISFSDHLLLVYRNTTNFCMIILYPQLCWTGFFNLIAFWWLLWDFLCIGSGHLQIRDSFTSSFPKCMPLISLSFLTTLVRTSSTIVNSLWQERMSLPCS